MSDEPTDGERSGDLGERWSDHDEPSVSDANSGGLGDRWSDDDDESSTDEKPFPSGSSDTDSGDTEFAGFDTDDDPFYGASAGSVPYDTPDSGSDDSDEVAEPESPAEPIEPATDEPEPEPESVDAEPKPDSPTEPTGPDPEAEAPDAGASLETDGEGVVGPGDVIDDQPVHDEPEYPDPDEDIDGISTPPDDEEMPLADHIEEMVFRFARVLLWFATGTALGLLFASDALSYMWVDIFPAEEGDVPPPHVYHPLELWLTRIKLSALLGIMVGLPAFVYECYKFMRPGLYPHERKYYLASVPLSVVLAALGMVFSYLAVLPLLFQYFTYYAEGSADIAYALGDTFNLIITLTGFLAIVFQIPLFIMLAIMMGVTTRRWLAQKRLYFWAAFVGLAFMFTVDPTGMAPILVGGTMILLFEGTLLVLKWVGTE